MVTSRFKTTLEKRLEEKTPLIQILLGPRQVGKTTAAQAIFQEWEGPKVMASADSPTPPNVEWIRFHWEQAKAKGPGTLLILDEIQKVHAWSEQVKVLFDPIRGTGALKIVLLGSSSLYLQRGLSESLMGRFEIIEALHWSYADCKKTFGWDFDTYLHFGAYPAAASFAGDPERWRNYILHSIIEPVLSKDILALHPVQKPALLRQTFELAVQHPAHILSLQKMLGQLQDRGNATTIKHYLTLLEQSFLIKTLQKFSGSTMQTRSSSPKIIVLNPALIHAYQPQERLKRELEWFGFMLESVVGAHLLRLPMSQLYYWREGNMEVDFILKMPDKTVAIEIKSGRTKSAKGLHLFTKSHKNMIGQVWDLPRCLSFLETGLLPD